MDTRAPLIVGLLLLGAGVVLLALAGRRRAVRRAENALSVLCSRLGLSPIQQGASLLQYFRECPSIGSPLRLARGIVNGHEVEICLVSIVKRSNLGKTLVGIRCPSLRGIAVGLSHRDAASVITHSLFGVPNGVGTTALFGEYDAWGSASDAERTFTPEIQSQLLALGRTLTQVLLCRDEVILEWKGIEDDPNAMGQAFRLAGLLCEAANRLRRHGSQVPI
jgi:hypothetical protein